MRRLKKRKILRPQLNIMREHGRAASCANTSYASRQGTRSPMKPHGVAPKKKRPAPKLKAARACAGFCDASSRTLQESPAHVTLAEMECSVADVIPRL